MKKKADEIRHLELLLAQNYSQYEHTPVYMQTLDLKSSKVEDSFTSKNRNIQTLDQRNQQNMYKRSSS